MTKHSQPGDLRVNRGHALRRLGRITGMADGGRPALPAPHTTIFTKSGSIELHFDAAADAAEWCTRYDLHRREFVEGGSRVVDGYGTWEDYDISVRGWAPVDDSVPADTDPDDLAEHYDASEFADDFVCACGETYSGIGSLTEHIEEANAKPIEDVAPRGTNAAEVHVPVPDDVEGHAVNGRGLAFTWAVEHGGALRHWDLTGPAGYLRFEIADAMGLQVASVYVRPVGWDTGDAEPDALARSLARQLREDFMGAGDDERVIRAQLETWYGEHLAGGDA